MRPVIVSLTVDTENPQTPLFEKRFSDNRLLAQGHAVPRIMDICASHGVTGSFFTNVYEYPVWGRGEMARLCQAITEAGHQVELHTHPIWIDDKRREHMFMFPLAEQTAIVQWGADFIEQACGRRPVCHRAGAYGFNRDTMIACRQAGLAIDSSDFFGHPNCQVSYTRNRVKEAEGIIEAPVTFFRRGNQVVKTDLDWMSEEEFWAFYEQVKQDPDNNFINLFLHSYSLLRHTRDFSRWQPDPDKAAKLERILARLASDPDCALTPLSGLAGEAESGPRPELEEKAIQELHPEPAGPVTLILAEPGASISGMEGLRAKLSAAGRRVKVSTLYQEIAGEIERAGLEWFDPKKELGRHYYREMVGWTVVYPEQPQHFESFGDVYADFLALPEVGVWNGHDLHYQGDYNLAHSIGHLLFYLIDLLQDLIDHLHPDEIISIGPGGEDTSMVRNVLRDLSGENGFSLEISSSGPKFGEV